MIITIGRQHGSSGREIARLLAKELGIKCYDKEIVDEAAKHSDFSRELINAYDEKRMSAFLLHAGGYGLNENFRLNMEVVSAQFDAIREIASKEDCIFVGRCADYVLNGTENLVRLFVYAEIEERINKVREKGYFPEEDILKNIKRIDRERRDYYRYYTGKSWENLENYDLMINTTKLSYDDMVECVVDYLKMRGILAK